MNVDTREIVIKLGKNIKTLLLLRLCIYLRWPREVTSSHWLSRWVGNSMECGMVCSTVNRW